MEQRWRGAGKKQCSLRSLLSISSLLKERTFLKYIEEYLLFRFDESLNDIGCPTGESYPFSCSIQQLKTVQARFDVISDVDYRQTFRHVRHGLMLLWFKDLMNVTEKLQFIDPIFRHSCLVSSSGVI